MQHKCNLITSSVLRGLQVLLGLAVLGLSITLIRNHNEHGGSLFQYTKVPIILPFCAGIGALSLVAALFSLAMAWTNFLREYIEMLVDVLIILANVVGGIIIAIKLKSAKCGNSSRENMVGSTGARPFEGSLGSIDILNGGCFDYNDKKYCYNTNEDENFGRMNMRCKQSRADSGFMLITVVVLFATLTLTCLRLKKSF